MKRAAALALAGMSLALMAQAKPVLVPDVSARRIEIRYSFTGAQLLLFGAIIDAIIVGIMVEWIGTERNFLCIR